MGWVGVGALLRITKDPIVTIQACAEAAPSPTHPTLQRAPGAEPTYPEARGAECRESDIERSRARESLHMSR